MAFGKKVLEAYNIRLANITSVAISVMGEVKSLDTFDSPGGNDFHIEGLYSTEIFGRVGDRTRDVKFGHINIKAKIMHPAMFRSLRLIRNFYVDVMMGREFATWDDKAKEFVKSNPVDGKTGYSFFMSKWKDLKFEKGDSLLRADRVDMINKYRTTGLYTVIPVLPAGLRDVEIKDGRVSEHEINAYYKSIIAICNTLPNDISLEDSVFDNARVSLQNKLNELYAYLINFIGGGKYNYITKNWTSRNLIAGTRNVITAVDPSCVDLDDEFEPNINNTIMGIWQTSKALILHSIVKLNDFVKDSFMGSEGYAKLINPKNLQNEIVKCRPVVFDLWTSPDGLEKIISSLEYLDLRDTPVVIDGHFLKLVYKPKDRMVFKVFDDIRDLPDGFNKDDVYPITYIELIYLCDFDGWSKALTNTRYPINGEGSTMYSKIYVQTTVVSERRALLGVDWSLSGVDDRYAQSYPLLNESTKYIDSCKVSPFRLRDAGGDYDGDQMSNNGLYTEEANREMDKHLTTREAYVKPDGGFRGSIAIDTMDFTLYNLTGDVDESLS